MTSVSAALPLLDVNGDSVLAHWGERDYSDILTDPGWPTLCDRFIRQILLLHGRTDLGLLMPGLPLHPGAMLPTQMLGTRARNVLHRAGIHSWSELAAESAEGLSELRNAGTRTVNEILGMALVFADSASHVPVESPEQLAILTPSGNDSFRRPQDIASELGALASWAVRERNATTISDLLEIAGDLRAPHDLVTSWSEVGIALADLAMPELTRPTLSELYEELLTQLGDSRRLVLEERMLAEQPKTLDELGRTRGVTREAIRLDEKKLKRDLSNLLTRREFAPFQWRAWDLRRSLGSLSPASAASVTLALDHALRDVDERHRVPVLQFLLRLAGPYHRRQGWFVCEDIPGVPSARELWEAHAPAVVLNLEECRRWLAQRHVDPSYLPEWLATTGDARMVGDKVLRWSGSVVDKAVALLALGAEPATPEELVERIGEGHSPRGLRNRLFEDPRVVRVDKYRFALREWEMEEYSGIAEEIAQRIREGDGTAALDDVVHQLVETFGVAETSVRAYAEAPMFVRDGCEHPASRGRRRVRRRWRPLRVQWGLSPAQTGTSAT